jgi:hypothetical protein
MAGIWDGRSGFSLVRGEVSREEPVSDLIGELNTKGAASW